MSSIIQNLINSALKNTAKNILLFNVSSALDIIGLEANLYSLENVDIHNIVNITDGHLKLVNIDCIVNMSPYNDNYPKIMQFAANSRLPIYNYITSLPEGKQEIINLRSRQIENDTNIVGNKDVFDRVYLPNKQLLSMKEFSEFLRNE